MKLLKTCSNHTEADFYKGVLEANHINAFIQSDDCGGMAPHLNILVPIKIMVKEEDFEKASQIIKDFENKSVAPKRGVISHVEIYTSELDKSRNFWEWFLKELGYELFQEWEEGFSFKLENTYIVFVQTVEKYCDIEFNRCRSGLNHLAFYADSEEFVDYMRGKILEKGMKELYSDRFPGAGGDNCYALFFEDPHRLKVEVVFNYE
ncbi:MAG: DUF2007 domain-containing protein [Candidatus Muiribacteriota bacterium]